MSKAYKCDRCGGFYEPYFHTILITYGSMNNVKNLCPECNGKLEKWLKKANEAADGN